MQLARIIRKYATYVEDYSADRSWNFGQIADSASDEVRLPADREALKTEIAALLAAELSDDELNALWSTTNAGLKFKRDGARLFLTEWLYSLEHNTRRYTL